MLIELLTLNLGLGLQIVQILSGPNIHELHVGSSYEVGQAYITQRHLTIYFKLSAFYTPVGELSYPMMIHVAGGARAGPDA